MVMMRTDRSRWELLGFGGASILCVRLYGDKFVGVCGYNDMLIDKLGWMDCTTTEECKCDPMAFQSNVHYRQRSNLYKPQFNCSLHRKNQQQLHLATMCGRLAFSFPSDRRQDLGGCDWLQARISNAPGALLLASNAILVA
jgi:hypothetical protein